jgi:hypothetical protein
MANSPNNPTGAAYPTLHSLQFNNVLQPAARAKPQAYPVTRMGNISFPQFNKNATGQMPTAKTIIRSLIRGNTTG